MSELPTRASGLPAELRAALELIVERLGRDVGRIPPGVIGHPGLVAELRRYVPGGDDEDCLVALGAQPDALAVALRAGRPATVLTLVAGALQGPLGRIRRGALPLPPDLAPGAWRALGYERVDGRGVQGVGAIAWAGGARVARRGNRPDVADRCRAAMLLTLVASRAAGPVATVLLREYRRIP